MIKEPYNRILILEDEPDLLFSLKDYFIESGFDVCVASNAEEVPSLIKNNEFDILLFDIMLPGKSGLELCRELKGEGLNTPIMFLTALSSDNDQFFGITGGAVDYVIKPFSLPTLVAKCERIIQLYRRTDEENSLIYGPFKLLPGKQELILCNDVIALENKEYHLLEYFIINARITCTREQIINGAFSNYDVDIRSVDTYVKKLRKKLGKYRDSIKTIRNVGYRFE